MRRSSPPILMLCAPRIQENVFFMFQFVWNQPPGNTLTFWKPWAPVMLICGTSGFATTAGTPARRITPARNSFNIVGVKMCVKLRLPKFIVSLCGRSNAGRILVKL